MYDAVSEQTIAVKMLIYFNPSMGHKLTYARLFQPVVESIIYIFFSFLWVY